MRLLSFALVFLSTLPAAEQPDLSWIAGSWQGKLGSFSIDEVWMPAGDGVMAGMFRMARGGKVTLFEFMTLDASGGNGPVLRLRHFNQALQAREEKGAPLEFRLVESGVKMAKFRAEENGGIVVTLVYRATGDGLAVDFEKTGVPKPERVTFSFGRRER